MDRIPQPETIFKAWLPNLIASRGADGSMRIEGVASSTVQDHHGDQFTEKALRKMAESAIGMTIFLNHDYRVPQDLFGRVEKARVLKTDEFDAKTGKPIFDMRVGILVTKSNPVAVTTFEAIEAGTKLGLSVGAMVPDNGAVFEKSHGGRYLVDDCELVEASVVGLPANPRSFIDHVVKAFAGEFATNGETGEDNPRFLQKKLSLMKSLEDSGDSEEKEVEGDGIEKTGIEAPADGSMSAEITGDGTGAALPEIMSAGVGDEPATDDTEAALDEALDKNPIVKGVSHADLDLEKAKSKTPAEHQHPHAHVHTGEHQHGYGDSATVHDHEHAHVHSHSHGDEHDHQDGYNDYEHNHYHSGSHDVNDATGMAPEDHAHGNAVATKDIHPDVVKDLHPDLSKTKVSIWDGDKAIEIDTGRSKPKGDEDQSAQGEGSENDGGAQGSTGVKKSDDGASTVTAVIDPATDTSTSLVKALRGQLAGAKAENVTILAERDAAIALGERMLNEAKAIMTKLGNLPVGRKTLTGEFVDPEIQKADDRIDSLSGIYSDEVRAIIKGHR